MKKVAKFGIVALLLVSLVGSAFAFGNRGFGNEAARDALEAGDYTAWKNAMSEGLTEEKFNQMRERHGQITEKRAEMQEKNTERQAKMDEACETGIIPEDLEGPMAEKLTENFDAICQLHAARKDGMNPNDLKELAEELGLEKLECKSGKMFRPRKMGHRMPGITSE